MTLSRIANIAVMECERQHVGLERLHTLLKGYEYAMKHEGEITYDFLMTLAGIVEPDNHGRTRVTPVTFAQGVSSAANHSEVERLLDNLLNYGDEMPLMKWVKQFLWIHPFNDGNGRVAWILLNMRKDTMQHPVPLPDFKF